MADRGAAAAKPIWLKQAEEAKLKSEAEKAAAAKAAFEATFKGVEAAAEGEGSGASSDSDGEGEDATAGKPVGPVDPSKCTAAGAGIAGGTACAPSSFVVVAKDADGRKVPWGGAKLRVKISPGVGVGGADQEGMVKDQGDGTYTVTYAVPKRGNYMVHVECDGKPIMGSPFPVFFSSGAAVGSGVVAAPVAPYPNLVNQTMPNMPNYSGSVSGAFPGLLGMIPGAIPGASGGVVLPGIGATLGEVCREYLSGRCSKGDCKYAHPPHNLLMMALAATTTMGTLSQQPMAPSAAAMAAAQAIVAAQALQAHAAQVQAQAKSKGDTPEKADTLKKTVQVSNLNPLLTVEHLKQLFGFCGTVIDCTITDSKHFAYIEYSKPEEAAAALHLNNMDVGGRPLNVEMAKSLPSKSSVSSSSLQQSSLPLMMQQAVALQQMQFQQSLIVQQNLAAQQAATRAATMKSATEMASARAAEISKKLKPEISNEDKEAPRKSRSPSVSHSRSKSRSRSPVKYRRSRRSRSFSPPVRYSRDRRSRTPLRSRHRTDHRSERKSYRDDRDEYSRSGRQERERSRDQYSSVSRRNRSRSKSPHMRKSSRAGSTSPRRRKESSSPRVRKSSHAVSKSPMHHRGNISPPRHNHGTSSRHSRHSRSRSADRKHHYTEGVDKMETNKKDLDFEKVDRSTAAKDSRKIKEDKAMQSSPVSHATTSRHTRQSRSRSADGGQHSSDGEDKSKVDRKKLDSGKSNKNRLSEKDADTVTKDTRERKKDKPVDSSSISQKRSSMVSEDETVGSGKDHGKHKRSRMDDQVSEKIDPTAKDQSPAANKTEVRQDKRSASSPASKLHRKGSLHVDDSEDWSRHEKSSSRHREHEKSGAVTRERGSGDSRRPASSPTSRSHRKGSSHVGESEDRSRHEKSSSKHRGHDKCDTLTREKESGDDRRASYYSSSQSHKRNSRHLEENFSRNTGESNRRDKSKPEERDAGDPSRRDKSKVDHEKHERESVYPSRRDKPKVDHERHEREIGDTSRQARSKVVHEKHERDTGDQSRQDKSKVVREKHDRSAATKEDRHVDSALDVREESRRGSLSPEDGAVRRSKNNRGFETSKVDNGQGSDIDLIDRKKARIDTNSENLGEYANAQDELKTDNRNLVLEGHIHVSDKNDHRKCEISMVESEEDTNTEHHKKSDSVEYCGKEACNPVVEDQYYTSHSVKDFQNSQLHDDVDLTDKEVNYSKHASEQHDDGNNIILSGPESPHNFLKDSCVRRCTDFVYVEHAQTDDHNHVDRGSADMKVYSSPKTNSITENHCDVDCKRGGLSDSESADFCSNSQSCEKISLLQDPQSFVESQGEKQAMKEIFTEQDHALLPDHVMSHFVEYAIRKEMVEEEQWKPEDSNIIKDESSALHGIFESVGDATSKSSKTNKISILCCDGAQDMTGEMEQDEYKHCNGVDNTF